MHSLPPTLRKFAAGPATAAPPRPPCPALRGLPATASPIQQLSQKAMNQEPRKMATSPESIGQQIVNLITTSNLVTGCSGFCLWVPNAASQLDALIASHEAELLRQLAAATEAADTASAEAAALDILLADVHYDLKLDNEQDAMERIERFRSRNADV